MIVNNKLGGAWKEMVVASLKVQFHTPSEGLRKIVKSQDRKSNGNLLNPPYLIQIVFV
jgi:hypothetical protein